MKTFNTAIVDISSQEEFTFECFNNDEPINIGDYYLFFFGGIASVGRCYSESEMSEINKHDRPKNSCHIDLVHGFWRNCYKIKTTNFDYSLIFD